MSEKVVEFKKREEANEAFEWYVDQILTGCGSFGMGLLEPNSDLEHVYIGVERNPEKGNSVHVRLDVLTVDGGLIRIGEKTVDMSELEKDYETILRKTDEVIQKELNK